MKKLTVLFSLVFLALASTQLLAQSPVLSIQGLVQKSFGAALEDGTYSLTFKLYNVETGGTALWSETQEVEVTGGVYSALLGSVEDLTLPFNATYYLGVTVESGAELLPRARLTSTPYALALIGQSNVFPSSGNVGVGTATPNMPLTIAGSDLISLRSAAGSNRWHLGLIGNGLNFAESGVSDGRLFLEPGGNVGISTTDPTERLHVNGNIRLADDSDILGTDVIQGFNDLHFQGNPSTTDMYIAADGNIGMGTTSPSSKLDVVGDIEISGSRLHVNSNGNVGIATASPAFTLHVNGTFAVENMPFFDGGNVQWSTTNQQFGYDNSSRRFKENITPMAEDFFKILDLQPVRYTRPGRPDRWELGFIAEEADSLGLSPLVEYDQNEQVEGFNYEKALTYLVPILRQQQAQIEALQSEVAALKTQAGKVQALEAKFAALSALLEKGQTAAGE